MPLLVRADEVIE